MWAEADGKREAPMQGYMPQDAEAPPHDNFSPFGPSRHLPVPRRLAQPQSPMTPVFHPQAQLPQQQMWRPPSFSPQVQYDVAGPRMSSGGMMFHEGSSRPYPPPMMPGQELSRDRLPFGHQQTHQTAYEPQQLWQQHSRSMPEEGGRPLGPPGYGHQQLPGFPQYMSPSSVAPFSVMAPGPSQWSQNPSAFDPARRSVPPRIRVPWTEEEENLLRKTVAAVGRRWKAVAAIVQSRTEHQCRERWRLFKRKEAQMRADETSLPATLRNGPFLEIGPSDTTDSSGRVVAAAAKKTDSISSGSET